MPAEFVRRWLRAEGADPAAPAEEQLGLAWRLLRRAEARLGDLERRRAEELREVRAGSRRRGRRYRCASLASRARGVSRGEVAAGRLFPLGPVAKCRARLSAAGRCL